MMREHSCYENMPGAFCLMRADGSERIVRCNEMMLSLFQCSTEKAFLELTGGCLRGMVIAVGCALTLIYTWQYWIKPFYR